MISLKLIIALLIFVAGLAGSLPALKKTQHWKSLLFFSEYLARGIFLGIALLHLLPEALQRYQQQVTAIHYPPIFLIVAATFFLVQLIEQANLQFAAQYNKDQQWLPYLLFILLSIHSVIAGAALGTNHSISHIVVLFIAIIAHKSAAAFALAINMHQHKLQKRLILKLMILFCLMTPLGILTSSLINLAPLTEAIFSAVAAGTFLYIAAFQYPNLDDSQQRHKLSATLTFGAGITLMALLALYG